ncbi:MAG: hypothetical protein D6755_06670 [Anaerolineae bacterium]|nr:MAG: hypothetical protein D6755_06670 [Anaerolineae bacterium]
MVMVKFTLRDDYWETFQLEEADIEHLYNHLLEVETPLTPEEMLSVLVEGRVQREIARIENERKAGGEVYAPREHYEVGQQLLFPALGWQRGEVVNVRPGKNPDLGTFSVIEVAFASGEHREFAADYPDHPLNNPPEVATGEEFDPQHIIATYGDALLQALQEGLQAHPDFVRIAGRWFPRALLVDINIGHLNLAEAVLDMAGGGPLPTSEIIKQIELTANATPKLLEFSLDLALQEDERFDEVGPAGDVLWYLRRLEPEGVITQPLVLRYTPMEYDRDVLEPEMLVLEQILDDELSAPYVAADDFPGAVQVPLIFPHWQAGTLPLSSRIAPIFPTAYEAPRVRFMLVDGRTGERFPGWVVRKERYVYGLKEWYEKNGLMPGSLVSVRRGENPGDVIVECGTRRANKEWVRTALIGSDGGIVFATLPQRVSTEYDERMAIIISDVDALHALWEEGRYQRMPFERVVVNMTRELSKLTPQAHVHATELYAAINLVRRCPPGPLLGLLASRPWFVHVGDLYFRFDDSAE